MDDNQLIAWLRENSSGVYRPSAEAADRIEALLAERDALRKQLPPASILMVGDGEHRRVPPALAWTEILDTTPHLQSNGHGQ